MSQEPNGSTTTTTPAPDGASRVTEVHVFEEYWALPLGPTSRDGEPLDPPATDTIGTVEPVKVYMLRGADVEAVSRKAATDAVAEGRPEDERLGTFVSMLSQHAPTAQKRRLVVRHQYDDVPLEVVR